jgi:hypothetical protein
MNKIPIFFLNYNISYITLDILLVFLVKFVLLLE